MTDAFLHRPLGRSGISVSAMALGCYAMSSAYGTRCDEDSVLVIREAVDRGIRLLDTADYYGDGHNERLIATALQGRREEVLLSSKFGYIREPGGLRVCGDPAHLRRACEGTLQRLGTDHIDLYFQHRLDPDVPIEETVGAMADLVREGKVRMLGLCEVSETTLRRACAVHPITAVQAEFSLWTRDAEASMLDAFDRLGVTLMAFSPLARGMLTGRLRNLDQLEPNDARRRFPRFSPENFPRNVALVDRLGGMAAEIGCTLSQLALAWIWHRAPRAAAICGCDTLEFLAENLGALDIRLTPAQVEEIGRLFAPGLVAGDRYHASFQRYLDQS